MKPTNSKLAVYAFAGIAALFLAGALCPVLCISFIGSNALAAYSLSNTLILLLTVLIMTCTTIAVFRPNPILTFIACGIEVLGSIIFLIAPSPLLQMFSIPPDCLDMGRLFLQTSGIVMLVLAAACILFRVIVKKIDFIPYVIVLGVTTFLSILVPFLMMTILGYGMISSALSTIVQPFAVILPILMLNMDRTENGKPAGQKTSSRPYLDEYKRKMKEGK